MEERGNLIINAAEINPNYYHPESFKISAPVASLSFNLNGTEKVFSEKESLHTPSRPGNHKISKIVNPNT